MQDHKSQEWLSRMPRPLTNTKICLQTPRQQITSDLCMVNWLYNEMSGFDMDKVRILTARNPHLNSITANSIKSPLWENCVEAVITAV